MRFLVVIVASAPLLALPGCVTEIAPTPASFVDKMSARFSGCSALYDEERWRNEILRLVNLERAEAGLGALVFNEVLTTQASQYACEMIEGDFFGHYNPHTDTRLADRSEEFSYDYMKVGENLAAVPPKDCSPAEVMDYWMSSDGHRENILDPDFTELGVGIRTGGTYGTYWVQEFGQPK